MYHIIPDIHGQADKLDGLLAKLGWRKTTAGWAGPEPERKIMFLGDFIDGGPNNTRVLQTVRSLIDSGKAEAVMGNHEFNAIHYHTEVNGSPLRAHSEKNTDQHRSFLDEFPMGGAQTRDVIDWMLTLPLFWENEQFRAVHACWSQSHIDLIAQRLPLNRLTNEIITSSGWKTSELWDAAQIATSGPEVELPTGYSFNDKSGHLRKEVRIGWWVPGAKTWQSAAQSVPDPSQLPNGELPDRVAGTIYRDRKPVFFGHYWKTGTFALDAPFAACLDYSAGKDGPLVAYDLQSSTSSLSAGQIVC